MTEVGVTDVQRVTVVRDKPHKRGCLAACERTAGSAYIVE
jgi:hypothetical protein